MSSEFERHIPIEGTFNFRDIGGYATRDGGRVRWRTLFRSDSLHEVTEGGREAVRELGVRTALDLRSVREAAMRPSVFEAWEHVSYARMAIRTPSPDAPRPYDLLALNRAFLDEGQAGMAAIMNAFAEQLDLPLVFHCATGKDRTGLLTAMMLELAGVDRADVIDDYLLTNRYGGERIQREKDLAREDGRDMDEFTRLMECSAEIIETTLAYLDSTYGGAERYVLDAGVLPETLAAIRGRITER